MSGVAVPVVAGLATGIVFVVLFAMISNLSISPDIPQHLLQERSEISSMFAVSRAREVAGNDIVITALNYRWLPFDRDHVTIWTVGSVTYQPLYGNFTGVAREVKQTFVNPPPIDMHLLKDAAGFSTTESERSRIGVEIDRKTNSVLSTQMNLLPDRTTGIRFSEEQIKAIEIVLSDSRVQELADEQSYFIGLIRGIDGPSGNSLMVGLGLISEPERGVHTVVLVNLGTAQVTSITQPSGER